MSENNNQDHGGHDSRPEHDQHADEKGTLTLSATDFTALEERVMRAVEVVRRERLGRLAAEERATRAEAQTREQAPVIEQLEKELGVLRAERDHVRERVDRLLGQLDALEL
jgi:FtsZ-binding cell division protein ZapB